MQFSSFLQSSALLFALINLSQVHAAPTSANSSTSPPTVPNDAASSGQCADHLIINARGTAEIYGMQSTAFVSVNRQIQSQIKGVKIYNVNYAAGVLQMSDGGASDIVKKVKTTMTSNPNTCFFLEGYSQGAAATVKALTSLEAYKKNIRGVALVGDPKSSTGMQTAVFGGGANKGFKCVTMDLCTVGDPLCGIPNTLGMGLSHFDYIFNPSTHKKISDFAVQAFTKAVDTCNKGGTGGSQSGGNAPISKSASPLGIKLPFLG